MQNKLNFKTGFFLIFILFSQLIKPAHSQKLICRYKFEKNHYDIQKYRDNEDSFVSGYERIGIKPQKFDSFPSRWGGQFVLLYRIKRSQYLGVCTDFYSTGSRVHYRDYSGELTYDQVLKRASLGIHYEIKFMGFKHFQLRPFMQISGIKTKWRHEYKSRIYEAENIENMERETYTLGIIPSVLLQYELGLFTLGAEIGFEFSYYKLPMGNDLTFEHDWEGARAGISLGVALF